MEKLAVRQGHGERQQGSLVPPYYEVACPPPPTTGKDPRIVCLGTQGPLLAQTVRLFESHLVLLTGSRTTHLPHGAGTPPFH